MALRFDTTADATPKMVRDRRARLLIAGQSVQGASESDGAMIDRYTRPAMGALWTDEARMEAWRRVEMAACKEMDGPSEAELEAIRGASFKVEAVQEREAITDHDVAAFVDIVSASAGDAGRWIHFGLTSSDVLDTRGLQLRAAGEIVLERVRRVRRTSAERDEHRSADAIGARVTLARGRRALGISALVAGTLLVSGCGGGSDQSCVDSPGSATANTSQPPQTVLWDPAQRPRREADTLFLPDLRSVQTITAAGGFLRGPHGATSKQAQSQYEFGRGRFGPGVRPKAREPGNYVNFPVDGLMPGDEFTIEFSARLDKNWSSVNLGRPFFGISGQNTLGLGLEKRRLSLSASALAFAPKPRFNAAWSAPIAQLGLRRGRWYSFALTLKDRTLRLYLDGRPIGVIPKTSFLPVWSDETRGAGIQIGGEPGVSTGFWISDVRISRTARTPHKRVVLRGIDGVLDVQCGRVAGRLPSTFVGAVHPTLSASPAQVSSALSLTRTGKELTATPIRRGGPDAAHPTLGHSGRFSYDWRVVDRSVDYFKRYRQAAFLELGSIPQIVGGKVAPFTNGGADHHDLARDPSFYSAWAAQKPTDYAAWGDIVRDYVHHVQVEKRLPVLRWGIGNEPMLAGFWEGTMAEWLDFYAATARAVRAADPQAVVGGPEAIPGDTKWIPALFARARSDDLPLDYISYHDYSGDLTHLEYVRAVVDEAARANGFRTPFPVVLSEANWALTNIYRIGDAHWKDNAWTLSAFGAAYETASLIRMAQVGGFLGRVRYLTEPPGPVRDGSGETTLRLLGPDGRQWAPFNAFQGWQKAISGRILPTSRDLPPGVYALASRSPAGGVGLVLASYGFAQRASRNVTINVRGLREGSWRLRRWVVDSTHSSRWDAVREGPGDVRQDHLERVQSEQIDVSGTARFTVHLPPWSSSFVTLERAAP